MQVTVAKKLTDKQTKKKEEKEKKRMKNGRG